MLFHVIDFLVDYFTNLTVRKIVGGILVLIGMAVIGRMGLSGSPNSAMLYAIGGILIGGVGFILIYYDIAQDKIGSRHSEIDTLTKGYEQKRREEKKLTGWHMNEESDKKNTSDSN